MLLRIRRLNENVLTSFQKVLTIYTAKFLDPQLDESPKKKTEKTQDEVFIAFAREVLEKYIDTIGNMFQQAASDFVRLCYDLNAEFQWLSVYERDPSSIWTKMRWKRYKRARLVRSILQAQKSISC